MNSILYELKQHLLADEDVAAAVGQRVFRTNRPQAAKTPHILLTQFSDVGYSDLSGLSAGLSRARIQLDTFDADQEAAWLLGDKVRTKLQGFRGAWGTQTVHAVVTDESPEIGDDPPQDKSDIRRYFASRDYLITHSETI